MRAKITRVPLDEIASDVPGFFERVRRGRAVLVTDEHRDVAVVQPIAHATVIARHAPAAGAPRRRSCATSSPWAPSLLPCPIGR